MEVFKHDLENLFSQLGLASDKDSIELFLSEHSVPASTSLQDATFWTQSQQQFLREALLQDADWSEQIDLLDSRLRRQ
ncbi:hypothetical protein CS022_15130 [Veronia nyctiphanis]|uniref:DUF2789 domain-containing protein n=1 Tax=Veronia nyctiphanis TaxID=1278244 RepID=A0A4V1LSQ5_9GAMM|nr:DUF2789 family protein [Veronia nyctiphanis]RXJ72518.1 hypothetical protein CS022_15130 [Veronia nyctiphanis]